MLGFRSSLYQLSDRLKELLLVAWLSTPLTDLKFHRREVPVIISMTSYPGRISKTWIAVETLFRQSVRAEKIVLVLNEEEFPNRVIPRSLRRQQGRGLSILWIRENGRSYDKLLPVRKSYAGKTVITCDDDKFFPTRLIESLVEMSSHHPGKIIGSRGWLVRLSSDGEIHYGENWTRASFGDFGRDLLMPGGNGCLYPWGSLHPEVDDVETALRICPTADDIWFWSAALKNKSEFFCLGFPPHRPITAQKKSGTLSSINSTENDSQFQSAINQFGIRGVIRESIDQRQLDQDA